MSFLALSLIPEEITIFRRSPSEKRRFFNRTQSILDESFFKLLKDYNKTLAEIKVISLEMSKYNKPQKTNRRENNAENKKDT